jgi:hypothetical protein
VSDTMTRIIIPSLTDDHEFITAQLPSIWDAWVASQPPGNYTCMDMAVEPCAGLWCVVLSVSEEETPSCSP